MSQAEAPARQRTPGLGERDTRPNPHEARPCRRVSRGHPPVVLGNGKRLFADGTTPTALKLIDTKTTSRGVVAHVYQPSGKPEYGSVALEREGDVVKDSVSRQDAT